MPQVIAFIATTLATVFTTGGAAAAASTVASVGAASLAAGAALGAGIAALGASAVLGLVTPHKPAINSGSQILFKADKQAGVPYLIGRTGTGGNIVFIDTSNDGHNKWAHYFVVFSVGPIDSFVSFTANQIAVTFDGAFKANSSDYANKMWLKTDLGTAAASAITAPTGTGTVPEWGTNNKLSGLAAARWVLQADNKVYTTGAPQPLWVLKGAKVYDPRLDSTYPGGSGAQRSATPSTWAWSENPYLHALTWCIGQTTNSIRVMGIGAPIAAIDVAAFVTGANVADTNSWTIGGVVTSQDSKWDILAAMLQAGGGLPIRQGNLISCFVNTPLTSVVTLTGADFVGDFSATGTQPRRNRINRVMPTYRSEAHNWEMVTADPVSVSSYISADGQTRTKGITYALVQDVDQATQLARYDIENAREFGPVTMPLKPRWNGLKPGDCVTLAENEYGMSSQTLLVLSRDTDPSTGYPTLTCRSETNAKHAFALGLTGTAPPTPSLSAIDLINVAAPGAGVWTAAGVTLTDAGTGQQIGALQVTGAIDNPNAESIVVEYSPASAGTWSQVLAPPSATLINITAVIPNSSYDVRVSYIQRGNQGATATATGSPATSGAGANSATITNENLTDTGSYTWTSPAGFTDGPVWHIGQTPKNGFFLIGALVASFQSAVAAGNLNWQLVIRNHSGGGDAQVLASGFSGAVGTTGGIHVITNRQLTGNTYAANTSATSGDKDLVLQFKDTGAGATTSNLGTFGTGGGNTTFTGSYVASGS